MSKLEIERKFLVDATKVRLHEVLRRCTNQRTIYQPYLAADRGWEVRGRVSTYNDGLRSSYVIAEVTVKSPKVNGAGRYELDMMVDADWLKRQPVISSIEKTRREFMYDALKWELDEFHGANAGLWVAEIELPTADFHFEVPPWCYIEVTDDPRFSNVNLATTPYTQWKEE